MIKTVSVGMGPTNAYIYYNDRRQGILIDPADDASHILSEINKLKIKITAIIITHGHFDHTKAANEIKKALDVPIYASKKDATLANNQDQNGTNYFRFNPIAVNVDKFLPFDGDIDFDGIVMQVIATPGHTHGSICLYAPNDSVLFSGDTLFRQSYGRYDLPTGNFETLKISLEKLFALPDDTEVYPGHGSSTTIGYEKIHNLIKK